jgi:hypothetical protein
MDPLSAIGSAAVVLQFIQYAGKACHFVNTLREDNHDGFYEGVFTESTRHFVNFTRHFKTQRPVGFNLRSSSNQEVGRMQMLYKSMLDGSR